MKQLIALSLFLMVFGSAKTQKMELNMVGSAGFTHINLEETYGYPQDDPEKTAYGGCAQFLFNIDYDEVIMMGMEAGYTRLYYYNYYEPEYMWRSQDESRSIYFGLMFQYLPNKLYLQSGLDLHVINNHPDLIATIGIPLALGYKIPITEYFHIPIGMRSDFILGPRPFMTFQFTLGLAIIGS